MAVSPRTEIRGISVGSTNRANIREHLATRLEKPITSTQVALDHPAGCSIMRTAKADTISSSRGALSGAGEPFIEEEGANGLRHQHIHL